MFRFYIHRYLFKVATLRGLFIFSLIPALIYCIAVASQPDRFSIYQKIKIAPEAPMAVSGSPLDFAAADWFLVHQDELFLDAYTLQTLHRDMRRELPQQSAMHGDAQLVQMVKSAMTLSYIDTMLRVTYNGNDQAMGRFLTAFYAQRVLKKAEDGLRRQEMLRARQQALQEGRISPIPGAGPDFELAGGLTVESDRALWRSERAPLTLLLLAIGLAAVLIWIGIQEMLDTSFKSERQVARFLHAPVLGSVPNLSRVSKVMSFKI